MNRSEQIYQTLLFENTKVVEVIRMELEFNSKVRGAEGRT